MSLVVLKNKTAAKQKITHRQAPASTINKHWMHHGPFGPNTTRNSIMLQHGIQNRQAHGFVTHGSSNRSLKYIGKSSAMSTTRTADLAANITVATHRIIQTMFVREWKYEEINIPFKIQDYCL